MQAVNSDLISVWKANCEEINFTALDKDIEADVAIIGGGITGITAAHLLSNKGKNVVVLEAWKIGEGTSGYSTGNLYGVVDERLQKIKSKFDRETVQKVIASRMKALVHIENTIKEFGIKCDYQRVPWYLFTQDESMVDDIEEEFASYNYAGLPGSLKDKMPLFPIKISLKINDQAQFNPMRFLKQYAAKIKSQYCRIYEQTVAMDVKEENGSCIIKTDHGNVSAKHVIFATHTPKGILPVQTFIGPYREYGMTFRLESENYPEPGIYWSMEKGHHHSLRTYENGKEKYLIAIGSPYKVGHSDDTEEGFRDLEEYVGRHFNIKSNAYKWAGQHYRPADLLPYIGPTKPGGNIYMATGYATDGLIYGTIAAEIITDQIAGIKNEYGEIYNSLRIKPTSSIGNFLKENLDVAAQFIKDLPGLFSHPELDEIKPGAAKVIKIESERVAAYRDEASKLHIVSANCPHMGCVVHWNGAEKSWDCPCHGSRFTTNGEVIEGPAYKGLEKIQEPK